METPPQPHQPVPGGTVPPPAGPGAGVVPRGRRLRLFLAVAAGVTALLCLGGVGVAFLLYDDATKIDRSAPDVVVDNYLRAFLVNRDDAEAALFRCKNPAGLAGVAGFREEIVNREANFGVRVSVSWSSLSVSTAAPGRQSVSVTMTITGSAAGVIRSQRAETWAFAVTDEDGWRVCSATKVG